MANKQLYRSCKNRMLAGVCGGLGEYFEIDPVLIRLVFLLLAFGGVGIVAYILAWVIIPEDPACNSGKTGTEEIKEKAESFAKEISKSTDTPRARTNGRMFIGLIVLLIGIIFLLQNILGVNFWSNFWPLILILIGLFVITGGMRK